MSSLWLEKLDGISKSEVSRICGELDTLVAASRTRPLTGEHRYLWVDATYHKVRVDGRVNSQATVVAVGVTTEGERQVPSPGQRLSAGYYEIRGLAWCGRGKIARVEISTDGGRSWTAARLQDPVLPLAHTRFSLEWRWNGSEAILQSRAVDESGDAQPTAAALIGARGRNSTYHNNAIQSWKLQSDGSVVHVEA